MVIKIIEVTQMQSKFAWKLVLHALERESAGPLSKWMLWNDFGILASNGTNFLLIG
jgi:hypothetical protein